MLQFARGNQREWSILCIALLIDVSASIAPVEADFHTRVAVVNRTVKRISRNWTEGRTGLRHRRGFALLQGCLLCRHRSR